MNKEKWGDTKMVEWKDAELILSHECTKNYTHRQNNSHRITTELWQNTSYLSNTKRFLTKMGRREKQTEKGNQCRTCPAANERQRRKSVLTLGHPLSSEEVSREDRKGVSEACRRKQQGLDRQNWEKLAKRVPAIPHPKHKPAGLGQAGLLELRLHR